MAKKRWWAVLAYGADRVDERASKEKSEETVDCMYLVDWVTSSRDVGAILLRQAITLKSVKALDYSPGLQNAYSAMTNIVANVQKRCDSEIQDIERRLEREIESNRRSYSYDRYHHERRREMESELKVRRSHQEALSEIARHYTDLANFIPEAIERDKIATARALSLDERVAGEIEGDTLIIDTSSMSENMVSLMESYRQACLKIQPQLTSRVSLTQLATAIELIDGMVRELVRQLMVEKQNMTIDADGQLEFAMLEATTLVGGI